MRTQYESNSLDKAIVDIILRPGHLLPPTLRLHPTCLSPALYVHITGKYDVIHKPGHCQLGQLSLSSFLGR